jgi:hypothetical protein
VRISRRNYVGLNTWLRLWVVFETPAKKPMQGQAKLVQHGLDAFKFRIELSGEDTAKP